MDIASIGLIMALIREGYKMVAEGVKLLDKIKKGEKITEADVAAGRQRARSAVAKWDEQTKNPAS